MKAILVVAAALSSITAVAQTENVTETLINPWYYCVGRATGRQPDRFKSPEIAVERGFAACQTEEMAVTSFGGLNGIPPAQMSAIISSHRSRLKQSIVSKLLEKPGK